MPRMPRKSAKFMQRLCTEDNMNRTIDALSAGSIQSETIRSNFDCLPPLRDSKP